MKFRYVLEPYTSKRKNYRCPNCNKIEFVRFIDSDNNELLPYEYGRCNRVIKCGYFKKPKSNCIARSINDNINKNNNLSFEKLSNHLLISNQLNFKIQCNPLYEFLIKYFEIQKVLEALERYQVKTELINNEVLTVFPLIDNCQKLRALKKMKYDKKTGKRDKNFFRWHNPQKLNLQQCLFGLHLLEENPFKDVDKVYIVESEKTAIIASLAFSGSLFMATGGLNNLNINRLKPLKDKRIILMPDLASENSKNNPYFLWKEKGQKIAKELDLVIAVNKMLLEVSTEMQREEQWDLADFIIAGKDDNSALLF